MQTVKPSFFHCPIALSILYKTLIVHTLFIHILLVESSNSVTVVIYAFATTVKPITIPIAISVELIKFQQE